MSEHLPQTIDWPLHGAATRLIPRGMSDYARGCDDRSAIYATKDGHRLTWTSHGGWRAQYRGITTTPFPTATLAIESLTMRLARLGVAC